MFQYPCVMPPLFYAKRPAKQIPIYCLLLRAALHGICQIQLEPLCHLLLFKYTHLFLYGQEGRKTDSRGHCKTQAAGNPNTLFSILISRYDSCCSIWKTDFLSIYRLIRDDSNIRICIYSCNPNSSRICRQRLQQAVSTIK